MEVVLTLVCKVNETACGVFLCKLAINTKSTTLVLCKKKPNLNHVRKGSRKGCQCCFRID